MAESVENSHRPGRGKCLLSTRRLCPGDCVLEERPLVFVVAPKCRGDRCAQCLKTREEAGTELLRCSACKWCNYCSTRCQRRAWSDHQAECRSLRQVTATGRSPQVSVLLMQRVLRKYWAGDAGCRSALEEMEGHETMRTPEDCERLATLANVIREMISHEIPFGDVVSLFCKTECNTFTIVDGEMRDLGAGIYRTASRINHDCDPNCVVTFMGPKLRLHCVAPVAAGIELTIGYVDIAAVRAVRRSELQARYFFPCTCIRCQEESTETHLACPHCPGMVLGVSERCTRVRCVLCGHERDASSLETMDLQATTLERVGDRNLALGQLNEARKVFEEVLQRVHHDLFYTRFRVLRSLLDVHVAGQSWEEARRTIQQAVELGQEISRIPHPTLGLLFAMQGRLAWNNEDIRVTLEAYSAATRILAVTHGSDHPLVKDLAVRMLEARMAGSGLSASLLEES